MAFLPFLVFATEGISQTNLLLNKRFVTEANDASYTQQLEQQVKAGMDINQIDPRTGLNAISMLIHLRAKDKELLESANSLIKLLLANGADPNQVIAPSRDFSKWEGYSPLQTAVHYEFKEIVQTLIDGWADVNAKVPFPDWRTPLHLAVDMRNEEIVQALIDGWADLDTKTLDGYTALHLAVDKGNKEIVQALIKAGADPDIMTHDGYTALYLAVDKGNKAIIQALIKAGATPELENKGTLTSSEIGRLRRLIVDNWNIGALSSEAKRVILTVRIRMDKTGKPIEIELYYSEGGVNGKAVEVAFEVARRAITKGLENGHDLPKEKYYLWKEVLYTFNPQQMMNR